MENLKSIKLFSLKAMCTYCNTEKLSVLHELKLYLDDLYYNTGEECVSNDLYDVLKDILIERDAGYVPPIGSKIRRSDNRVKIPFYMGSVDKITPSDQTVMDRWFVNNVCNEVLVTDKLDGVSGTFVYKDGKSKLYTRGDGQVGGDISYLIQYINSIPCNLQSDLAVRGELIIKKKVFEEKYYDEGEQASGKYRNSRNMVSGLVGAKTVRGGLTDIKFVAYEIIGESVMECPYVQLKKLKKFGFLVPNHKIVNAVDILSYVDLHNDFKRGSEYDIDGIVVQSNVSYDRNIDGNPSYMFAFKMNSEDSIYKTIVKDIEWSISGHGQIIPVAIVEPVKLSGITISRVTVSNAGLMKKKNIGPGAIINVTRSNDVIPFICGVVKGCDKLKYPDVPYKWDTNEVHLNVVDPSSEVSSEMEIKLFSKFFNKMSIKHVSDETVSKMYYSGLNTLIKIIGASKDDLMNVAGIKEKSATRIYDNIRIGLKGVKVSTLLGASGMFGYGIGVRRVEALMADIPDICGSNKRSDMKSRILNVSGFSELTAEKVFSNIDNAIYFIDEISKYATFASDTRVSDGLVGKIFCFSGFRSKELEQNITDRGGKTSTSVSKKTSGIIVIGDSTSGKVTKAVSLGVSVYTKEEFIKKFL